MLTPRYSPADLRKELKPALSLISEKLSPLPQVGTYGNGILTILDVATSKTLLQSWGEILGSGLVPLATTGFGDVFAWDAAKGVCFLEVQRADSEPIGPDLQRFLRDFLGNPKIAEAVLKESKFQQLVQLKGALQYGQCFILEPWQMLGGVDKLENYSIGQSAVFIDLVGQTHQ